MKICTILCIIINSWDFIKHPCIGGTPYVQTTPPLGYIYFGTGKSGSTLNGIVECPNRPIAEAVRAKLYNSGLDDQFWCYAAADTVFKHYRMLHAGIKTTLYSIVR